MIARREDEAEILAYFDASPDETIWLRICWYDHERFAVKRDAGRVVALSTHAKNGVLHVHAPTGLAEVANEAVRLDAKITAVAGPPEQVTQAVELLGLSKRPVLRLSREILMSVRLDELVRPKLLSEQGVVSRRATGEDLPLLIEWRKLYFQEVHQLVASEKLISEVEEHMKAGRLWVLEVGGEVVNTAAFSAVFPGILQIEYAYGPPETRAKKYGRSAVAGALDAVKGEGIKRAVFNTDINNTAVQQGIVPIGFKKTGDYHVTVFAD